MTDYSLFAKKSSGQNELLLSVEGMHCAGCMRKIENALNSYESVKARVNLSTKRVSILWQGSRELANNYAKVIEDIGYTVKAFEIDEQEKTDINELNYLLRCMAVAGISTVAIMVVADALWAGGMGSATESMLQWISALIAFPAIIYSGMPFYKSAFAALKKKQTNMDVPISLAVILASLLSFYETFRHGEYVYYDSAVMLLFFLLIGRYLDKITRARAKSATQSLLSMVRGTANVKLNGKLQQVKISEILPGMILVVSSGEKFPADGILLDDAEIESSAITGEFAAQKLAGGSKVFAGAVNIGAVVETYVTCATENSLLNDIVKAMETAEQSRSKYVRVADRVARLYTPIVHILAAAAFIYWFANGHSWQSALMTATTILIITCPCAMGLAVPVVQVLAITKLYKSGLLVKSGDALEKLAKIKKIVFDKTGTLTLGRPVLNSSHDSSSLQLAASMAAQSSHPLSKTLAAHYTGKLLPIKVTEEKGRGLISENAKLGSAAFIGVNSPNDIMMEIWLKETGKEPVRFTFSDEIKADSADIISELNKEYDVYLLSGDRTEPVNQIARKLGIKNYKSEVGPTAKVEFIKELGPNVLMVGDGLNDAAALKTASVSISPASAIDIAQSAADIILQGDNLLPINLAISTAKRARLLVAQNFYLAVGYNIISVPMAFAGYVTPLIAAIAMSSSSIIVILNSLRISKWK